MLSDADHLMSEIEGAMYDVDISYDGDKINFKLCGNYHKIVQICKLTIAMLLSSEMISDDTFQMTTHVLKIKCKNEIYNNSIEKAHIIVEKILKKKYYDQNNVLHSLQNITKKSATDVFKKCIKNNNMTLLISGNCKKELAIAISDSFKIFHNMKDNTLKTPLCRLQIKTLTRKIQNDNNIEKNNCVIVNIFVGKLNYNNCDDYTNYCIVKLLNNVIQTAFFYKLRTQESFGYIVKNKIYFVNDVDYKLCYHRFIVVSPNKTVDEIQNRILKFIKEFDGIELMSNCEFITLKNSLIDVINEKIENLLKMSSIYFFEIENNTTKLQEKATKIYTKLSKKDVVDFYKKKYVNSPIELNIGIQKNSTHSIIA